MSTPETRERATRRRRRVRRRALKNLRTALGEAGDQLTIDWVLQDRDLQTLRKEMRNDPNWVALVRPAREEKEARPLRARVPSRRSDSDTLKVSAPAYPWHPVVVLAFWLAAFLVFGYLLLRARANDAWWAFTLLAAIATLTAAAYLVAAVVKRVVRRRLVRRPRNDETAP